LPFSKHLSTQYRCRCIQLRRRVEVEARVIAKEAYIYGCPIVNNYRVQYAYFVDTKSPEYKAPWNHIWNGERLFSPEDKVIQTANSDTLYSMICADLRAEPIVLTIPKIEKAGW
jgi:hypothetical protein